MTITAPLASGDWTVENTNGSVNNKTILKPANAVAGDGLALFAQFRNAGGTLSITNPDGSPATGWLLVGPVSTANQTAQLYVRTVTSGDPVSWKVTTTAGSNRALLQLRIIRGADLTSAVIGILSTPATESTLTIPGVTTPVANCGVFLLGTAQNGSTTGVTFTPASPWNASYLSHDTDNGSSSTSSLFGFGIKATAGATGAISVGMASGSSPAASADQGWAVSFSPVSTPPTTSNAYEWNGSAWVLVTAYMHNGSTYVPLS